MRPRRRRSLRAKLIAIITLSTLLPLLLGFAIVIINDGRSLRRELVDQTVLIARVTAENSVSDVAFNDRESATRTLSKLASIPAIRWAAIFDAHGQTFSEFATHGVTSPAARPGADGMRLFTGPELRVSEPIVYNGDRYGTLFLAISTDALQAKAREHLITLLFVMIGVAGAAIILAMKLAPIVSRPILNLAALARGVSEMHDYSLRADRTTEDEVGVLADGFNEMLRQIEKRQRERDEADRRTREKSQFLANMSHELRTPLNAIIGFSEVLQTRLAGRVHERESRFLENIHSSGQHLLGIVNDILDLSKVEAGRMEINPEAMSVRTAVEGVSALMRAITARRQVTLEIDLPDDLPPIEADSVKVKQVLYNLLSNAVKFSPEKSTVTIRARRAIPSEPPLYSDAVRISVIDHGIGIDAKDHVRIFQEFQQVDSTLSRQFEGTGLGLTLVKKFVEMHSGAVELDSSLGSGSKFTVTLPRLFRGVGVVLHEATIAPSDRTRLVLVIEDDEQAYGAIAARLSAAGYVPHHAKNGEEGIARAKELRPAAITLDLVLPGIDGLEVLKTLKSDPSTCPIPVIIVSVIDNRELGLAFGANDYFIKPVDGDRVVETLRRLVTPSQREGGRLLVIDDDRALHDLLDARLRPHGYELLHAYGVADGMIRAANDEPSLVILDLMMQGMNGFDVAARLKSDPRTARVPILAVTNEELSGGDRARLQGKFSAMVERGELSGNRLVTVIQELVQAVV
jgi:signal transduction histidine kinase/DNA-binding response OmpR family regulator